MEAEDKWRMGAQMTDAQQLHLMRRRLLDVDSALQMAQEAMAMAMLQELIEEAKSAVKVTAPPPETETCGLMYQTHQAREG